MCYALCDKTSQNCSRTKRGWTCSRSRRSARRAGLGEARFVIRQDSHIDLVLFVGFLISFSEQAIIAAARPRLRRRQASSAAGAHIQSNLKCCPSRLSQDVFFCMRCVGKHSYFSLLQESRTIRRIRRKLVWVPSLVFFVVHSMAGYAVVVQDLATQWIQAYPCKNKTSQETQRSLQKFLEPERKPKVIYTDNTLEFGKACEDLSWNHCTSTPHRSETNGIAERAVRRVKEGTSAVLLQSGLLFHLVHWLSITL